MSHYVIANIQIPIEILENEKLELMPEYISIQIQNCEQLPEKKNLTNVQSSLLEQIKDAVERKRLQDEKVLLPLDRPIKKRPQNITFKQYRQPSSRNTLRNYDTESESSESSDSDPIERGSGSDYDNQDQDQDQDQDQISINSKDMDVDSSQPQEVLELELANDQLHLNLREDEYQE